MIMNMDTERFRIAVISGKLGDVDGVSLEVDKWIDILSSLGHEIYTIAGVYGSNLKSVPEERRYTVDSIRFTSEEQRAFETQVFPHMLKHPPYLSEEGKRALLHQLEALGSRTANVILEYIRDNDIDVLIAENTNAMPMTLIGGTAVYKLAVEQRIATIFHHHDFWWERSRFSHNHIDTLLNRIMPPADPGLEHVVISSYSAHILRSLKRVQPRVIPNCEDFEHAVGIDEYNADFRSSLGFSEEDVLIVQPTRIVRRKRIEDSLALISRLAAKYRDLEGRIQFVISLYQGDEPDENYIDYIRGIAESMNIPLHMISDWVSAERGVDEEGRKQYTSRDVLAHADIVTYLPVWEGFGNALLEATAARVPVVTTTYLVYKTDIKIMGFDNIEIRDVYDDEGRLVIPERAVDEMYRLLNNPEERKRIVEKNFRIARKEFGFKKLKKELEDLLKEYAPEILASRNRIEKGKRSYSV